MNMIKPSKNIPIKDKLLLQKALTHRSWLNENVGKTSESNERLEFLGDAVLELIISEYLFNKYPKFNEGVLTAFRASLVKTETLAKVAKSLKLGKILLLSHGEEISGGRQNKSLLADTFEAIIGAIYLDSGKKATSLFLDKHLIPELQDIIDKRLDKDAKSTLQEIAQSQEKETPIYKVLKEEGPDHDKIFTVAVFINGKHVSKGTGKSKQQAQQEAAKKALEKNPLD
jgi:ribonuclease-3